MKAQRWIRVLVDVPVNEDVEPEKVVGDVVALLAGSAYGSSGQLVSAYPAGEWTMLDGGRLDIGATLRSLEDEPSDVALTDGEWTNE